MKLAEIMEVPKQKQQKHMDRKGRSTSHREKKEQNWLTFLEQTNSLQNCKGNVKEPPEV